MGRYVKAYGYEIYDNYKLNDSKHIPEQDYYVFLRLYNITEEQIMQSVEFLRQHCYCDDGKFYENTPEAIENHLKYKEYPEQKEKS